MREYKILLKLWCFGILAIVVAYFWLDREIAGYIHVHHVREFLFHMPNLMKAVEWPAVVGRYAPIVLFVLLVFRVNPSHQASKWQNMVLLLCFSVLLTYVLKNDLKWVFSRYWPETWRNENLSWIRHGVYGFQWLQGKPFEGNDTVGSFPSGHSGVAFATFVSIGLYYRKWLSVCLLLATLEALMMVVFNYHFLSDVIAGACLGTTCAVLCYFLFFSRLASHES